MATILEVLDAISTGDPRAAPELLPLVYNELKCLAAHRLAEERPGQTLQATALVHEAYLRVVGADPAKPWNGRNHFFAAAAEAMRRILVDAARSKARIKRGGGRHRLDLDKITVADDVADDKLLAINEALDALAIEDTAKAEVVKLRFFAGLTLEEAAACQGVSLATANRRWAVARAWLFDWLNREKDQP